MRDVIKLQAKCVPNQKTTTKQTPTTQDKKTFADSECLLRLDIKASSTYLELYFPLNVKGYPAA